MALRDRLRTWVIRRLAAGWRLPARPAIEKALLLESLRTLLRSHHIDVVLDVGANRGQFVDTIRALGFAGVVHSFEPIAEECAGLRERAAADGRWFIHNLAIGDVAGEAEFNLLRVGGGATVFSSLHAPLSSPTMLSTTLQSHEVRRVQVRRLDDVVAELGHGAGVRYFLKSDTQGHDLAVIRGASGLGAAVVGLLAELAVQPLYDDVPPMSESMRAIVAEGFRLVDLGVVNRTDEGQVLEYDALWVRAA